MWLLDDLDELLTRIGRRPIQGQRVSQHALLRERIADARASARATTTRSPVALAALLHQQARWHRYTIRGRALRTRRPRLVRRLRSAIDATLAEAEHRYPHAEDAPTLHRVTPSFARLSARLKTLGERLDEVRTQTSMTTLVEQLGVETRNLRGEADLLLAHADGTPATRAAAGRWLDRAFELEAQWLTLSFGVDPGAPLVAWHALQQTQRAIRQGVVAP